jgi:hypothetical protein
MTENPRRPGESAAGESVIIHTAPEEPYNLIDSLIDIGEERRVPSQVEVKAMLENYFTGLITDEIASKLTDYVARVIADPPLHAGETSKFHPGNGRRGFGMAWREQLAFCRTYPRSIDLAAWLAASTEGYPEPRPYCPDFYIGRWMQKDPETTSAYVWELDACGRFHTNHPLYSDRDRWCVHRTNPGPKGDQIWFDDELGISHYSVIVYDVTAKELTVKPSSPDVADCPNHLIRV